MAVREEEGEKVEASMRVAVKKVLTSTSPGKFVKGKCGGCYKAINKDGNAKGPRLRGVSRLLSENLWSKGLLPDSALKSDFRGKFWGGDNGGQNRGKAVDKQVSRLVNAGPSSLKTSKMLRLTKSVFSAFDYFGLKPVLSQRVVISERAHIGTAADAICLRGEKELVVVELKTGYGGNKSAPAVLNGKTCFMSSPCSTAKDCNLHRHLAQLSATLALFKCEKTTMDRLHDMGIERISGVLLYASENGTEMHELPDWWIKRGGRLISLLKDV